MTASFFLDIGQKNISVCPTKLQLWLITIANVYVLALHLV